MAKGKYEIGAFYFPNLHPGDKHNAKWHGKDWTEWELMKNATPRFEGHSMPKVPLWGYENEALVPVMEKKIKTAAEYGVNNFIFDWYWYEDGPFLNRPLDEAFLHCSNVNDIKFSIMWANHDWEEIQPLPRGYISSPHTQREWQLSDESFYKAIDYINGNYFAKPNYCRIDGKCFFSIYEVSKFVDNFGGKEGAKKAIAEFRRMAREAGVGEIHLNAIAWSTRILLTQSDSSLGSDVLKDLGFDSVTSYVWIHEHVIENYPSVKYADFRDICEKDYARLTEKYKGMAYYPNITCGWDPSPRTCQSDEYGDFGYPFSRVLSDNTPEEFEIALRNIKEFLDNSDLETKMFTVNAWNEWTEGSYLEPDTEYGYGKLQAIKKVFYGE